VAGQFEFDEDPVDASGRAHGPFVPLEAGRGLHEFSAAGQERDELAVEVVDAGTDLGEGFGCGHAPMRAPARRAGGRRFDSGTGAR
jgi:hypothetical protein